MADESEVEQQPDEEHGKRVARSAGRASLRRRGGLGQCAGVQAGESCQPWNAVGTSSSALNVVELERVRPVEQRPRERVVERMART